MTQTTGKFFDDIAKFMTDAAGAAQGARSEFENAVRSQAEKFLRSMDVPQREEFEAVKAMAAKAREENKRLEERIAVLELTRDENKTPSSSADAQNLPPAPADPV